MYIVAVIFSYLYHFDSNHQQIFANMELTTAQTEVTNLLKLLNSSIAHDLNGLSLKFNKFLQVDQDYIITFMNYQFFRGDHNLIIFLTKSIAEGPKSDEDVRKLIYKFISDYIINFKDYVVEYLPSLYQKIYSFFKKQTSFRPKAQSLSPIKEMLINFSSNDLNGVFDPASFHKSLTTILKIETKMSSTVRGQIWEIVGLVQNKFASLISYTDKKDVQIACLYQLKQLVKKNENFSTIASILKSYTASLVQNYLQDPNLEQLFNYAKAIMIPLADTYGASIAALQLISQQSNLFHPMIMKNAGHIFKTLTGLMGHQNKEYKFAVLDTLAIIAKQIVIGISANLEDPKMIQLFNFIGNTMWGMLQQQTKYDPSQKQQKNRFYSSVISIVKILGTISPLILSINGKNDLKRFFSKLLTICNRKVIKAFQQTDSSSGVNRKIHMMKIILYNQKQLVSFIGSFAKIIEQLEDIDDKEGLSLEQLFLVGVRQYPYYLEKYIPQLIQAMIQFLMGLYTKHHIFGSWCKKVVLISLMQSLDTKRFNINTQAEYYQMIKKTARMWKQIITHALWKAQIRKQFSIIVFDNLEHLFLNLDVSYKTSLQLDIESQELQKDREEDMQIINVFFMSDENLEMCNVADYQYVSSLSLVFNQLMLHIDANLYTDRLYGFYEQIIYRIKIFPKSIPLMKVLRSLNAFITRTKWFGNDDNKEDEVKKNKQLLCILCNFFKFISENIYKYQQNYFYQALKMLLSMPIQVYLNEECQILKNKLPGLISKSLELGQEVISLANETIECMQHIFKHAKQESVLHLSSCLPYLEKYINFNLNKSTQEKEKGQFCQEKEEVRSYLFLHQCRISRSNISARVMKFLGAIGGISHMMVENSTKDYISWDFYCKLDLAVVMGGQNIDINLTKLLARTNWLMLHGTQAQKIVSSQFMHAIVVYVIGRAAFRLQMQTGQETKENLSNFFDRVLPTILSVSANPSHPCQQLMHTLTIQTIHFLANTQDSNSPDIQTLLKNLISMYTGAEDLSFLASKCLSQLVKWHIKQAPEVKDYPFPIVKTVIRNIWSLISNKKARNGLIQFLIKFLKAIHRHQKLMSMYAIQLCSLIISIGRSNKQIEPMLDYLVRKYILAISPYMKSLIVEEDTRKFRKLSTIQKMIQWIYDNSLFSVYRQQRTISYEIWAAVLGKYGNFFNCNMRTGEIAHNIQIFLSDHCDRERKYLFSQNKAVIIEEEQPKLEKQLPRITAIGQMWIKIVEKGIFEASKIMKFKDYEQVYLQSMCSFVQYLTETFNNLPASAKILNYEAQRSILDCLLTFVNLYLALDKQKNSSQTIEFLIKRIAIFEKHNSNQLTLVQLMLKLIYRPNSLIPNFNYDIIYQSCQNLILQNPQKTNQNQMIRKQMQQTYYFTRITLFLTSLLSNNVIPFVQSYLKREFKVTRVADLLPVVVTDTGFYDREIKCVVTSLAILANAVGADNLFFQPVLKRAMEFTVASIQDIQTRNVHISDEEQRRVSSQKKVLLIWYLLQHAENYSLIRDFLVAVIQNDTKIHQKYQRNVMKSIVNNWLGVGQKIVNLARKNLNFLKLIFVLCKVLPDKKKQNLYELVQNYLVGVGLEDNSKNTMMNIQQSQEQKKQALLRKASIISQMLKICFFFAEDQKNIDFMTKQFEGYVYDLVCEGFDISYSSDIHQQALNLSGLLIRQLNPSPSFPPFIQSLRLRLSKLTTFYIPSRISRLATPQSRNKCSTYLKMFKSMVILSNDIRYLQFIFSFLKDKDLEGYYYDLLQDTINQCLMLCYERKGVEEQSRDLGWMIGFYWDVGFDTDFWANVRVVFVDQVMKKAIKMTKQQVLINFFQQQSQKLLTKCIKSPINSYFNSPKQLILQLQLKRAAFQILEQLYSNLPKKQKNTEQIHKKQLHKQLIINCNNFLKPKKMEQLKIIEQAELILKQFDKKIQQEDKQKKQKVADDKKGRAVDYLRRFFCAVYNCLVVTFISTQSNKAHFQTYLFQSKGILWKKLVDEQQQEFNFEIETSFPLMQPITKINTKLQKKIKQKYWQSSLYAIEQEYVPASLAENIHEQQPAEHQPNQNNQNGRINQSNALQLDIINKHPCMVNLLRVIDFMHEKFYDGTLPGWMKPIHEELVSDACPLSIRILLTKLIVNRPQVFTQNIWAEALLKYLSLKQNGGKFIHYFYRDVIKHFISFIKNSYKPQSISQVNTVVMKVIKLLPHPTNIYIYNDNMQILSSLLKIQGVRVSKQTVVSMLKSNDKNKADVTLKFQWRLCIAMVLKFCMQYYVPVLDDNEQLPKNSDNQARFKFYFNFRKDGYLNLIFQLAGEMVKKYRIAAAGFLGQLLKFIIGSAADKQEQEEVFKLIAKFLANMNMEQSNRNSKQRFSLIILNVVMRFPAILDDTRLYNQVQSSFSIYIKQERLQILQTFQQYCKYTIAKGALGYIPHIFITIRGIITKVLNDIQEVQSHLISLLNFCCKHEILINKQIIETYYYIYDDLEKVFANSVNQGDALNYYKVLISLKDFTNDPDLPKTNQIRELNYKIKKSLLRGLGSSYEQVRKLLFDQFQRQFKDYSNSADRMIDILVKLYDSDHESLWLVNVVPLIFSLVKQSSDYTRLRFQKPLAQITSYYDWDFRKNMKAYNNSQPFTPAFTLSTGAMIRRPDGTIQPSFNPTIGGQKLRGIIRASQNSYLSQQQHVFTMLASQSDYQPSFQGSFTERSSQQTGQIKSSDSQQSDNKLSKIFLGAKKRRNKHMQQFHQANIKKYTPAVSVVGTNKLRFNKNFNNSVGRSTNFSSSQTGDNQPYVINTGNKKISVRKYKVGELPDVQIATKDLMDPMIYLAGCDHEFASQLFILIFIRVCLSSRIQKKQLFKKTICQLLKSSKHYEYNFISTLQKSLICLCHNIKQKMDFSMKDIALMSNTLDYAIVFTEENQIQTIKQPDIHDQQGWKTKVEEIWGDLVDLYQQINEEDLIYGVLIRLAKGDEKKLLLEALNLKKQGNIKKSQECFNSAMNQCNSNRLQQFIAKQKIECSTILGAWQPVIIEMSKKTQQGNLSINEQKIFTVALQNIQIGQKSQLMKKLTFHDTKCQYEKAILHILFSKDYDIAYHHLQKSFQYFSDEWRKISSFAFNWKHGLLEEVQKKMELQEFLSLYRKDEIQPFQYENLFSRWSNRHPSSVYDSNLTFLQILQSRRMFSDLFSQKFKINEKVLVRSTIDWLIQMANGMVQKGVLGGAQTLIKKALQCKKKQKQLFIWDFYDSVARLKLKQLMTQKNRAFHEYEIVANLVKKQMDLSHTQVTQLQKLKFISLKNSLFEAYLSSCLASEKQINTADFVNKIQLIYGNYNEIRKNLKQNIFQSSSTKQLEQYRRQMFFKFTIFLQKMLTLVSQKNNQPQIRVALMGKNYNPERLSYLFVQMLFTSIEISDFTANMGNLHQNMVLSLIMKLIKIIQMYPSQVGEYFTDTITNKRIPVWIFLYFIPQMIKFITNPNLVQYFQDLFRSISTMYPQSLIYHFNCSYEQDKDRTTPFSNQLHKYLKQKMTINYLFIDALVLLQYPEIRLRQSLTRFLTIQYQRQNCVYQLEQLVKDSQFLGKYNKKFVQDWSSKVVRVVNKIRSNDLSVINDIKVILANIDPSNKDASHNLALIMRDFVKVSDGSLFFQQYNSNDWNRIQIPGTSYRKFQEPKPWKKVYIESFDHSLLTLQSKQRPRRITVYGSNEKKYMLLIKAGQDVRLDQRIEQLFQIMNRILKESSDCSKKQLNIRRFQVTPIKKMMGIFEWVDQSQTLKQFLQTEFKILKQTDKVNFKQKNKAFEYRMQFLNKISPHGSSKDQNHQHKALLNANKLDVVKCFIQCQKQIPYGLLRRALQRLSKNYDSFLHIKNSFIANYALVCCVTYILGIGDRHLENFLIHMSSASIVPIDFGFSFGASLELGVPELMPFRLTKCFTELMDPVGFEGVFKKSMISSFEAFAENVALISDYCEVFVDDPLLQWVWTNKKTTSQSKNAQFSSSQDPPEKALFAQKVMSVRKKLSGSNPRVLFESMLINSRHKQGNYLQTLRNAIWGNSKNRQKLLSTQDVVEELIAMATDKNILGRTYIGWNPYV